MWTTRLTLLACGLHSLQFLIFLSFSSIRLTYLLTTFLTLQLVSITKSCCAVFVWLRFPKSFSGILSLQSIAEFSSHSLYSNQCVWEHWRWNWYKRQHTGKSYFMRNAGYVGSLWIESQCVYPHSSCLCSWKLQLHRSSVVISD